MYHLNQTLKIRNPHTRRPNRQCSVRGNNFWNINTDEDHEENMPQVTTLN